ncbi:MAG: hypothetical protein ACR5LA_11085 [Wolbachia sp.]
MTPIYFQCSLILSFQCVTLESRKEASISYFHDNLFCFYGCISLVYLFCHSDE